MSEVTITLGDVPDLQQEVNRKAFDTMSFLINACAHGKITEDQFSTGVDTLSMALNGLVTELPNGISFISMITACDAEIKAGYPTVKRVFFKRGTTDFKVFEWQAGDDFIKVKFMELAGLHIKQVVYKTPKLAYDALKGMNAGGTLTKLGFEEL